MAKVTYHAAAAVAELKNLVQEFKNLNTVTTSAANASQASLSKIESKLLSIEILSGKTVNSLNKLRDSIDKNTLSNNKNSKALEYQLKLANAYNKKIAENTSLNKTNTKSINNNTSAFKSLRATLGLFLSVSFFKELATSIFEMAKDFDSLNFSMKVVSDTSFDLAASQRFLLRISEEYGVELLATSQRYVKFLAAAKQSNLSLNDTEKIFGSVTKAASVLGLKTDELSGVYLALEQMLSKGKVTTEELRRQLGERLPGAMGIMAAALDVSIPKLDEMLKKGEIMSAEALPKFAEALEAAYGIESVKKIDTLVAAQNRLINIWQTWIQDVATGDGVLSTFFKNAINNAKEFVKTIASVTGSNKLNTQLMTIEFEKETEDDLRKDALAKIKKQGIEIVDFSKQIESKKNEILLAGNSKRADLQNKSLEERDDILNQELSDLLKLQIKQNKIIEENEKSIARSKLAFSIKEYNIFKAQNERLIKETKEAEEELAEITRVANNGDYEKDKLELGDVEAYRKAQDAYSKLHSKYGDELAETISKNKENIKRSNTDLALATAWFNVYRKKLQVSENQIVKPKEKGGRKLVKKQLNEPIDLQGKIDIEKLKSSIRLNKLLIESDETYLEEKKQLILDISKYEIAIAKQVSKDNIALSENKYNKEIKSLKNYLSKGKITQKEHDDQIVLLNKQKNQKRELAELNYNKLMESSKAKASKALIKVEEAEDKVIIDRVKNKYNLEIDALNDVYNNSKKTAKDFEDLEKGKKRVSIEMANAIIDAQIKILNSQLAVKNQSEESIEKIKNAINKLEASRKSLSPDEEDLVNWYDWLEKVGEIINEVGNLIDASFNRKIENIEAEISAEEAKYDKLIALAENDADQQAALEKQKADRTAILEKEKLKAEQKAAKARKAFAIAEAVINTAVSIVKTGATMGYPAAIPFQVAAGVIGALQIATIAAQPIPQYKDGIDSVPNDQVAMINDGGKKEYVERDGKILSTNTKNAIVNLKKNDTVHKDYESMQKKSNIYSIIANGEILKQNEFDKLSQIMESSIIKGFSKAKINNNIKLNNKNSSYNNSNNYLKEKARFNG